MKNFKEIIAIFLTVFCFNTDVIGATRTCFEDGVRYPGNDIRSTKGLTADSPEDCQAECVKEPQCNVWTYNRENMNCNLKTQISQKEGGNNYISGPKTCPVGSKMMILNGYPFENGQNVEVVDLNDASFNCSQFPNTDKMYAGVAGIVDNTPMWCGGYDGGSKINHCQKLDLDLENKTWVHAVDLKEAKSSPGKGSIIVNGKLLVSGGYGRSRIDTIEMVSLSSKTIANFELPAPMWGHCNIQLNEFNYMITGGRTSSGTGKETFFQNLETGTITNGPNMRSVREHHSCTKFQLNGVNYALVLGGRYVSSIEYLNLDQKDARWTTARKIANDVRSGSYMLTHLNNVYLFGGDNNMNGIKKLVCEDTIYNCKFVIHGNFQYGRQYHSVIPIPDDIVDKFC